MILLLRLLPEKSAARLVQLQWYHIASAVKSQTRRKAEYTTAGLRASFLPQIFKAYLSIHKLIFAAR